MRRVEGRGRVGALLGLVAVLCAPAGAAGAGGQRKLAVLEFRNTAGLAAAEVAYLTDLVRGVAAERLGERYFVMTRENILEQLPPGTTLEACVGECEVETGRNVGADDAVFGDVIRFGSQLKVSLKLYDIAGNGRLRGQEVATAATVEALEKPVREAAGRLLARLDPRGGQVVEVAPAAPAPRRGPWQPEAAVPVSVESDPPGAALRINGQDVGQTPWAECVSPGPARLELVLPYHKTAVREVRFRPQPEGRTQTIRVRLEPNYGELRVETEPPGATILLDGREVGTAPWDSGRLNPGLHTVEARQPHHDPARRQVRITAGERTRVELAPAPREGALQLLARGPDGPVPAVVLVDGEEAGRAPVLVKLLEGSHRVEVRDPSGAHTPVTLNVDIPFQETVRRTVTLEPAGGAAPRPVPPSDAPTEPSLALRLTLGEGVVLYEGEAYRTNIALEPALAFRLGPLWPSLGASLAVEDPNAVILRPAVRLPLGAGFVEAAAQWMVTPETLWGAQVAAGTTFDLGGGWSAELGVAGTRWNEAAGLLPLEMRVGVSRAL